MANQEESVLVAELLGENGELTLGQLCRACGLPAEEVYALVEAGVVEPVGKAPVHWRFRSLSVWRVRRAVRLQRDLGVNRAGVALALDLLEELEILRAQIGADEGINGG